LTTTAWALLVVTAIVAVVDWIAVARGWTRVEYVAKPLTMLGLIGAALVGGAEGWVVAALVFCLAGDVFLMLPSDRFVPGLASFLLGHLAYVVGLSLDPDWRLAGLGIGVAVVGVAFVVLGPRVIGAVATRDKALLPPVGAYMAAISAMVASAVATGDLWAVAGAALFYASDTLIALDRFERPRPWAGLGIMVTYHLGQALIAAGVLAAL